MTEHKNVSHDRQIGALETLLGTKHYLESMGQTAREDVSSIAEQLEACSAILHHQGMVANDDEKIPCNVLFGLSDILGEQVKRLKELKGALEHLSQEPKAIAPGASVRFSEPKPRAATRVRK